MYIEVKKKSNDKYEVVPGVIPSAEAYCDAGMNPDSGEMVVVPSGKFLCIVRWNDEHQTFELITVEGDGVRNAKELLDEEIEVAGAWNYCGSCGNYSFYYPYNG